MSAEQRQDCINSFANQILQGRTVAAVPTWGNGDAPNRNAHNQAARIVAMAKLAAKAWAKRAGLPPPTDADEQKCAREIAAGILDASRVQVQIDETTERLVNGGTV